MDIISPVIRFLGVLLGNTCGSYSIYNSDKFSNYQITSESNKEGFYGQTNAVIDVHFKALFMKETASQNACVNWVVRKMSLELCIPTWVSPGSKQVSAMLLSLQKINSSLCTRFAMHCLRNQPFLISCIFLCLQIKEVFFLFFFLTTDNQIGIFFFPL